jgi:hypothetical protein
MTCSQASEVYSRLHFSIPIVKADFKIISDYVQMMGQLRSGFYCLVCDADFQSQLNYYWEQQNSKKFFLGMKFCEKYSKEAVKIVQYMYTNFRLYINSAVKLLQCAANANGVNEENENIMYEIPEEYMHDFQQCKDDISCNKFCTHFDLTTINTMIDGDVPQLSRLVAFFKKNRIHMQYPENNFMVSSTRDIETLLELNEETIKDAKVFFSSKTENDQMNQPNTQIYDSTGVDLFELTEGNKYPFFVESVALARNWMLLMLGVVFMFRF